MKKIVLLLFVLVMVFAFTIPAAAGGNGPGGGIGPGDGTGPVGDLGPVRSGQGLAMVPVIQAPQGPRINFTINGAIFAIGTGTVTITVTCGNKTAQPYIGYNKTVTVTPLTRYNLEDRLTEIPILFSDLKVGQLVSLNGTVVNGVWTVRRITVVPALDCEPLPNL